MTYTAFSTSCFNQEQGQTYSTGLKLTLSSLTGGASDLDNAIASGRAGMVDILIFVTGQAHNAAYYYISIAIICHEGRRLV